MVLDEPAQQIDGDIVVAYVEGEVDVEGDHPAVLGVDSKEQAGELAGRSTKAGPIQQPRHLDAVLAAQPDRFQSRDMRLHSGQHVLVDAADAPQQQDQGFQIARLGLDPGRQDWNGAIEDAHLHESPGPRDPSVAGVVRLRRRPVG